MWYLLQLPQGILLLEQLLRCHLSKSKRILVVAAGLWLSPGLTSRHRRSEPSALAESAEQLIAPRLAARVIRLGATRLLSRCQPQFESILISAVHGR